MSEDIRAKFFLPPDDYEILRFGASLLRMKKKELRG